jgi:hypothetical protein
MVYTFYQYLEDHFWGIFYKIIFVSQFTLWSRSMWSLLEGENWLNYNKDNNKQIN